MNAILPLVITAGTMSDFGDTVIGWFKELGSAIVGMLKAPFVAIAEIFGVWAYNIGSSWYAPIIMAIVLIVTIIITYFGFPAIEKLPGQ